MEKPRDKETTLQNLLLHSRPGPEQRSSGSPPSPAHGANAGIAALRDSRDDTHTTSCIPPVRSPGISTEKPYPEDHQHPSQHHHLQYPSHPKPDNALVSPQHAPKTAHPGRLNLFFPPSLLSSKPCTWDRPRLAACSQPLSSQD